MIKQERNKNNSPTYLVQTGATNNLQFRRMPSNVADKCIWHWLSLSNNFLLYGSVENSLWIAAIWRQEDASIVNICRTICAHDHCSPTFVILIGLWDVNETRFWSTYQPITAECNTSETYFGDVLDARVLSSVRVLALRAGILEQDKILLFVFSTIQFLGRTKIIISWWAFGSQPSAVIARVLSKNDV